MAQNFTFAIEDKEAAIGTPKFVLVDLTEPLIGANTWVLSTPNDWIGVGSGEYRVNGNQLELRDGSWSNERTRLVLGGIDYPGDLRGSGGSFKRGAGQYVSEVRQLSGASCEWSGRNIVPDQF